MATAIHTKKNGTDGTSAGSKSTGSTATSTMTAIKVAKVTLNVGAGKNEDLLKKGLKLLEKLSPHPPVKTFTKKRIPGWGLRPGLAIGCKVTVRKDAEKLLKRLLVAKENALSIKSFDDKGNVSFGIPEYIDIEGLEYDPDLKIIGLEVAVTLERPGYRVKSRAVRAESVGKKHQVNKQDAVAFIQNLGVEVRA